MFDGQTVAEARDRTAAVERSTTITLREYLTYRALQHGDAALVPGPARARHLRRAKTKKKINRYAISSSTRTTSPAVSSGRMVELQRDPFTDLDAPTLTRMMLYEYMIGNTDMSIWALHNVRIVQNPDRKLFAVAFYNFDLSGLVHAPTRRRIAALGLRSVVDRMYRGPCRTPTNSRAARRVPRQARRHARAARVDEGPRLVGARRERRNIWKASSGQIDRPATIKRRSSRLQAAADNVESEL